MRKNILATTASSFAIAALSATAFIMGTPVTAQAAAYCITGAADCSASNGGTKVATGGSQALAAGDTGAYETGGTFTVANGVTAGTVSTIVASTTTGTGILNISPTGGATGVGAVGSSTNYLGTVGVTGGVIGNTAAFSGVLNANTFNVNTATATVAGTAKANTVGLTGGVASFSGATNTIGALNEDATSTANLLGTSTIGTLTGAAGSTTHVNAATTINGTASTGTLNLTGGSVTLAGTGNNITTSLNQSAGTTANINGSTTLAALNAATGSTTDVTAATSVTGTAAADAVNLSGGSLTLGGAGNTIGTLTQTNATTANLNGTTTINALSSAGSTVNVAANTGVTTTSAIGTLGVSAGTLTLGGAATIGTAGLTGSGALTLNGAGNTITTLNAASGTTTNVNGTTTVTGLGTGTGAISVMGTNQLTLTNGASTSTGARGLTFATNNHTGAGGTVSNITSASANGINLSDATINFNATNTGGATDRTHYIIATDTGTGLITGPSAALVVVPTTGVAGSTYGIRTAADQKSEFVIQTLNTNYTSTATDGAGAANRAATSNYLQGTLVGSNQDIGGTGLNAYLNNLATVRTAGGANSAALGHVIDQAGAQSTVQVANNFASDYMNIVSDRTGVMQGTHTASSGANGISSGDASTGHAVWVEAFGSLGRQDTRGGAAGFDTQNGGFAIGAEKKLSAASSAGLSISYGAGQYQSNEAGAPKLTTSNDYQASIYGSSYMTPNWYIDGQVGGGYHEFSEGNTFVGVGSTSADYHGWGYFGQVGTGYDFHTSTPAIITPFAKLAYQALDSDDYTETGSVGLTRHISSDTAQTLTGYLGAKVAWQGLTAWNTKITPALRAAYFHDFEQDGLSTSANFTGTGSAATFSNTGNNLAKDGFTVGAGLTAARANGWNFDVNYDYEGRDGYNGHSGTVQAKYNF